MPQNLFAACRNDDQFIVKRVRLDNDVQQAVEAMFTEQEVQFRAGITEEIVFDGSWKPDDNEVLTVDVPDDAQLLIDALEENPLAIPDIDTAHFDTEGIKALFTGTTNNGATKVLVQRFTSQQLLSRKFSLLQNGNAFRRLSDPAFTLDTSLACIVEEGKLKFKSFYKAKAIVDLLEVYHAATDQELETFATHDSFEVENLEAFMELADQTSRKLIHAIIHSGTLDTHTTNDIVTKAGSVGVAVAENNGKIVMPETRAEIKKLLRFLDDGLYEAPLSGHRYVTNSKRPA